VPARIDGGELMHRSGGRRVAVGAGLPGSGRIAQDAVELGGIRPGVGEVAVVPTWKLDQIGLLNVEYSRSWWPRSMAGSSHGATGSCATRGAYLARVTHRQVQPEDRTEAAAGHEGTAGP
jgi:hypothetical protein